MIQVNEDKYDLLPLPHDLLIILGHDCAYLALESVYERCRSKP